MRARPRPAPDVSDDDAARAQPRSRRGTGQALTTARRLGHQEPRTRTAAPRGVQTSTRDQKPRKPHSSASAPHPPGPHAVRGRSRCAVWSHPERLLDRVERPGVSPVSVRCPPSGGCRVTAAPDKVTRARPMSPFSSDSRRRYRIDHTDDDLDLEPLAIGFFASLSSRLRLPPLRPCALPSLVPPPDLPVLRMTSPRWQPPVRTDR